MSATQEPKWLTTRDFTEPSGLLPDADGEQKLYKELGVRYTASKALTKLKQLTPEVVLEKHRPGTLTLVVLNRVSSAQQLFSEFARLVAESGATKSRKKAQYSPWKRLPFDLIHSRFLAANEGDCLMS